MTASVVEPNAPPVIRLPINAVSIFLSTVVVASQPSSSVLINRSSPFLSTVTVEGTLNSLKVYSPFICTIKVSCLFDVTFILSVSSATIVAQPESKAKAPNDDRWIIFFIVFLIY